MTIENLKQIAIKYATTKGSLVPLAPDELCNAVVQYMNSFFGVMTDINTIKVAVTEDSVNIVFTITGNTYDGKPITPIVITVDHNDFVTDQEFEEFKTTTNAAIQKNTESINSLSFRVEDTENDITNIQVQVGQINTRVGNTETAVTNLKNRVDNTETNIAKINSTLYNKLDKITIVSNSNQVYGKSAAGENLMYNLESHPNAGYILQYDSDGNIYVNKGSSEYTPANMQNIADVEAKIPDVSNFATKDEIPDVSGFATKSELSEKLDISGGTITGSIIVNGVVSTSSYKLGGVEVLYVDFPKIRVDVGNATYNINFLCSNRPTVTIGNYTYKIAFNHEIPKYTSVDSVIYDTTNGAIIAYSGANEIHIPLLAGENVTIGASEDNRKIVISAAGGGGTGDVTAAGNNTFTGENTFNNSIYAKNGVVAGDTTNYGANSVTKGSNTYSFPNKSGTFAMTTDTIQDPIYFISFYANEPSKSFHFIGTMMSKNSYGTGQKTNEEFAVMLADNFYTDSNEGLAAYGKLANKDILCIYSEDSLSIRCLDETNSEVDLPPVIFFVMETEL